MCNDLVSVLIPVYNVSRYISEAIDSILCQSYKNLEIILINDGSTDNTKEICEYYATSDKRIKVFDNEYEKGIVGALNFGLTKCNGFYIARMDGDDIAYPDRIKRQLEYLNANPDIDLVGFSILGIDEIGKELKVQYFPSGYDRLKKISKYVSPVSHIWMCRRKIYDELHGYRIPSSEDFDFLLRMITCGYKFENIEGYVGMKIRVRSGNTIDLLGLKQRKSREYAIKLFQERMTKGYDSYSSDDLFQYANCSRNEELNYSKSNVFLKKAIGSDNVVYKMYNIILACLMSKYQTKYVVRRVIYKILMLKYNVIK